MELLLDENRGIYIPQIFAQSVNFLKLDYVTEELIECLQICGEGPDNPDYWEAWETVVTNFEFNNGSTLYHDGDLWKLAKDEVPLFE